MSVEKLTREKKNQAVETLVAAFYDYPVMRYLLKTTGTEYETQVHALIGFFCESRFAKEGHVMGVRNADEYVAIGLVDEAIQKPWPEKDAELARLKDIIGESAFERLDLYERVSADAEPADPHYFLGMIGVLPEYHGKGYAREILDHAKILSISDRRSAGVCLSTENPKNIALYEHFGYRTIAEMQIEDLHSWCMFLPTIGPHPKMKP